ncbi:MAG: two-component regulator propeller domain-containing protein [Bacteroidota bacterium]
MIRYYLLLPLFVGLFGCESGNVPPRCCPDPSGELVWESYSLSAELIHDLSRGPEGKIWGATQLGLNVWEDEKWFRVGNTQYFIAGAEMHDLLLLDDSLYLGTDFGLYSHRDQWRSIYLGDTVQALGVAQSGGIWAASRNAKLWRYQTDGAFYEVVNPLETQMIPSFVYEEENGRLWLGTADGLLFVREAGLWRSENLEVPLTSIDQAPTGQIWIGTKGKGALRYENGQLIDQFGQNEGALSNWINTLLFDNRNRLWLGTDRGVNVISGIGTPDDILINLYDTSDGLISNQVQAILILSETDWWFGTDQGVSRRYVK